MPDVIPSLWPDRFKVDVQSPYSILKVQANALGKVTRGILRGEVETEAAKEQVQHRLVVIAPAFNSYRHTLLVVRHHPNLPYPAEVRAEALARQVKDPNPPIPLPALEYRTVYPSAFNDEQMLQIIGEALHSEATVAVILSLIAKSNEAKHAGLAEQDPGGG